jgi:uncharacterized damage-inducible protein DinB
MIDMRQKPDPSEFDPFYNTYVSRVPNGDIIDILAEEGERTAALFQSIDESKASFRYAEGKWSLADVVGHVVDTERLLSYRALRIARGDQSPMPGMEQDDWVAGTNFERRGLTSLAKEFLALRASNIALFSSLTDDELGRTGTASGCEFTVRALLYIVAGHAIHHAGILKERYLQ